jgi:hypothetical protein
MSERARREAPALALLLAVYLGWGLLYVHRTSFLAGAQRVYCLWDDGMISMTYARNLAQGHGLVWNAGEEPVQGYTNLGVTLAMAALHRLPVSIERTSLLFQLANLALLGATALLSWRLGRRALGLDADAALAAALALALCAPLALWSLQGADTAFVAAWLLLALGALAGERASAVRFWWIAPGIALRSDAFVLYLALWGATLLDAPGRRARALHGAAAFAAVFGATLLFGWLAYGDALPNTYYLKATGMPRMRMLARGVAQLGYWLPGLAALALAGLAAARRPRNPTALRALALVAAALAYHVWVGGDWVRRSGGRHLVPVLPPLLLLAVAGVAPLLARLRARRALLPAVAAALSLLLDPVVTAREWLDPRTPTLFRHYNARNHAFATYLRDFTHPSTRVAVHWAGVIPYFSHRPAVDVLGKSDRHIAHLSTDEFKPGHSKFDWDYVVSERRPDVLDAASRGLEFRADLLRDYWWVRTRREGYAWLDFYLRRESRAWLSDPEAVLADAPLRAPAPAGHEPDPEPQ